MIIEKTYKTDLEAISVLDQFSARAIDDFCQNISYFIEEDKNIEDLKLRVSDFLFNFDIENFNERKKFINLVFWSEIKVVYKLLRALISWWFVEGTRIYGKTSEAILKPKSALPDQIGETAAPQKPDQTYPRALKQALS